jgi:hypothetical protein
MFEPESEFCGVLIAQVSNGGNNRIDSSLQIQVKTLMPCVRGIIICVHKILCWVLNSSNHKTSAPSGLRKVYYYRMKLNYFHFLKMRSKLERTFQALLKKTNWEIRPLFHFIQVSFV